VVVYMFSVLLMCGLCIFEFCVILCAGIGFCIICFCLSWDFYAWLYILWFFKCVHMCMYVFSNLCVSVCVVYKCVVVCMCEFYYLRVFVCMCFFSNVFVFVCVCVGFLIYLGLNVYIFKVWVCVYVVFLLCACL